MSKVPISVCIIAKNEEKHIEECLKRLLPYGFEIIVTDTGSADRTKELAEKYADKVLDFAWVDDFSAARNFCAGQASNNWILSLDCDEYVTSIAVPQVRILMQKFPRMAGMIKLKNLVFDRNGRENYAVDDVVRFYNKNFFTYENAIHEQLVATGKVEKKGAFVLPMEVVHHGYALSPEEMEIKQRRNLDMLYKHLEKNPEDPYILFQMGQSEYILGDYEKSVDCYERALASDPSIELLYVQTLVTSLATAYAKGYRDEDALALMNKYADRCKTAKFVFTHAMAYYDNDQPLKALLLYLKTVTLPDAETLGENLIDCYENIINIYRQMGEAEMANMFVDKLEACRVEKERILNS